MEFQPPPALCASIALLVMAFLVYRAWMEVDANSKLTRWTVLGVFVFSLADLALLAGLPLLNLSLVYVEPAWLANTLLRAAPFLFFAVVFKWLKLWGSCFYSPRAAQRTVTILWALNLITFPLLVYAAYIEPFNPQITQIELEAPPFLPDRPLRIVHLSDLHVERTTIRERRLLEMVSSLDPDLIVLTGDYIHIDHRDDPIALADTRALLEELQAPYGTYAVIGTPSVDVPGAIESIFEDSHVVLLKDQITRLQFEGHDLYLIGISVTGRAQDSALLAQLVKTIPEGSYKLLLYHMPVLAEAAAKSGIDLYLAGHTHGGQFGLSFVAALLKRVGNYEYIQGQHLIGSMTLFVTRGVGMEGLAYPRMRFNAPPEVVLIELGKNK